MKFPLEDWGIIGCFAVPIGFVIVGFLKWIGLLGFVSSWIGQ